jgi:phosphatidylglycerol---prolipoprotein diacylglyceryl transferase
MKPQFHWYGFIVGIAVSVTLWLAERWSRRAGISEKEFWSAAWWILGGALIGARAWHVVTDWSLYVDSLWLALAIWNGGLSILGAMVGGGLGLVAWAWMTNSSWEKAKLLGDALALSLPLGQAIGRWGNYVNQELYGFPTRLPWGIFIAPAYRLPEFRDATRFHPLFLYESILVLGVWVVLWWQARKTWPLPPARRGWLAAQYVIAYALIRFWLDFGRPDRPVLWGTALSFNQWIAGTVVVVGVGWFGYTLWKQRNDE